jgi:hypothetical protein
MKINTITTAMTFLFAYVTTASPFSKLGDLSVAAALDNNSPTSLARRQDNTVSVQFCDNADWISCSWYYPIYGICNNLPQWAGISSVAGLASGDWCLLYSQANCAGDSVSVGNIADLNTVKFNDVPEAYACFFPS